MVAEPVEPPTFKQRMDSACLHVCPSRVSLRDCLRALKSGGVLRIIVPEAARYLRVYSEPDLSGVHELNVPNPFPLDLK